MDIEEGAQELNVKVLKPKSQLINRIPHLINKPVTFIT
jgi:hypothetical protein